MNSYNDESTSLDLLERSQSKERAFMHRTKLFLVLVCCFVAATSLASVFFEESHFYAKKSRSERRRRRRLQFGSGKDSNDDNVVETPAPTPVPTVSPTASPSKMPVPTAPTAPTAPPPCGFDSSGGIFATLFVCAIFCAPLGGTCKSVGGNVCCKR